MSLLFFPLISPLCINYFVFVIDIRSSSPPSHPPFALFFFLYNQRTQWLQNLSFSTPHSFEGAWPVISVFFYVSPNLNRQSLYYRHIHCLSCIFVQ